MEVPSNFARRKYGGGVQAPSLCSRHRACSPEGFELETLGNSTLNFMIQLGKGSSRRVDLEIQAWLSFRCALFSGNIDVLLHPHHFLSFHYPPSLLAHCFDASVIVVARTF